MKDALGHGSDAGLHSAGIQSLPRKPKPVSELPRAALLKALEKASEASSKVNREAIDAGHGMTKVSELMVLPGPLGDRYRETTVRQQELYAEKEARLRYQGTLHPIKKSKWL